MKPHSIYRLLATEFSRLGAVGPAPITHTAIVHDGYFVGYLYRCDDLRAFWFVDTGVVKFYDGNRRLLRRIRLSEQVRRAA